MLRPFFRPAVLWIALLAAAVVPRAWADDSAAATAPPAPSADRARLAPAVLVVRVWDAEVPGRTQPMVEVIEPAGLRWPLPAEFRSPPAATQPARDSAGAARDDRSPAPSAARLRLVRHTRPDPRDPRLNYYIYHLDFNNPQVADNYRQFLRARDDELRRQANADASRDAWERRKQQLLRAHASALHDGVALLQAGLYRPALISLTQAAELNHGDAACRMQLALVRVALGHDAEAAAALRRALELEPQLAPAQLDLAQYFPSSEEFQQHVDALGERLKRSPRPLADQYFLLGFLEFQRNHTDDAYAAFRRAARGMPNDARVKTFLSLTKPAQQ